MITTSANIRFDAASHRYFAPDGRELASVTTILSTEKLLPIYPDNGCKERGSAVHYCVLMLDKGRLQVGREYAPGRFEYPTVRNDDGSPATQLWGYLDSFRAYRRGVRARPIFTEHLVAHTGLWYAGTLDCALELLDQDGQLAVDDYKSGEPANAVKLQLAAYVLALAREDPRWRHAQRRAVHLQKDGSPAELTVCTDEQDFDDWITVVKHYHFIQRFRV